MFRMDRMVRFDKEDGGGNTPETDETKETKSSDGLPETWTAEQQAEFDKRAAALRKAALEKGKKEAAAEFEAKQKSEKEAAEKKRLEEEGKFKEMAEKAEAEKQAAMEKAADLERQTKNLKMQNEFASVVVNEKIVFANEQAERDAFEFLDKDIVGEDASGMKKAIEELQKSRSYLFASESDEKLDRTDASKKGKRLTKEQSDKEREAEIKQRFNIRKPR